MPEQKPLFLSSDGLPTEFGTSDTVPQSAVPSGIPLAKIAQSGASTGQVPSWSGSAWVPASVSSGEPNVVSPGQITANVDDYSPSGWSESTVVLLTSSGGYRIGGFAAVSSGAGRLKTLCNVGANALFIAPGITTSSAANRVLYREEVVLWPGSSCSIFYDTAASRWRVLNTPSPSYLVPTLSTRYDVSAERVSTAVSMDQCWDFWGSITLLEAAPSSGSRFNAFDMNSGSTASGGSGIMLVHDRSTGAVWSSDAHMVLRTHIRTPTALSDGTNHYYYFARLAAGPYSGFWNQANTVGFYYRHTENSGKWFLRTRDASSNESSLDTGVTFSADTEYELLMSLNLTAGEALFWINGDYVGRLTSNLPSNAVGLGWSQQLEKVSGTSARSMKCYRFMGAAIAI